MKAWRNLLFSSRREYTENAVANATRVHPWDVKNKVGPDYSARPPVHERFRWKALDNIDLNLVSRRYVSGVLKDDHFVSACSHAPRF